MAARPRGPSNATRSEIGLWKAVKGVFCPSSVAFVRYVPSRVQPLLRGTIQCMSWGSETKNSALPTTPFQSHGNGRVPPLLVVPIGQRQLHLIHRCLKIPFAPQFIWPSGPLRVPGAIRLGSVCQRYRLPRARQKCLRAACR